jgi:PAS domain S-box-containing protein
MAVAAALRESEAKLRLAVEATDLGLWDLDIPSGTLVWSDRLKAVYGLQPDAEITFDVYAAGLHPEDRDRVLAAYRGALTGENDGRFQVEHRAIAPDGAVRWLLGAGQVVFDAQGRPIRAIGTARDITDRKRGEEAVRQSEERYRLATEAFQGGVSDHDAVTGHVERTKRHLDIVGETYDTLPPTAAAWFSRIHPDDLPAYVEARRPLLEGHADQYEAEYRVRHRDGRWVWVWHRAMAMRDEAGRLRRIVGALLDVTERKQAEQAVRESEERYRLATDAFEGGVFDFDFATGRVERTRRHLEIIGERPEDFPPRREVWNERIHPDDWPVVDAARQPIFAGAAPQFEVEYRVRHRDGRWIWVWQRALALRDADGRLQRVIGTIVDITARRQAQEHQRLLLDELNHRVKNTLATVQSIAAQTLKTAPTPEEFARRFEGRILGLSRTHNLLTERHWQGVSLRTLLDTELAPYARCRLQGEDVSLAARMAVTLGLVFHELATNAAKYGALSRPEGWVWVEWRLDRVDGTAQRLHLTWTETGGPLVQAPQCTGFGSRLIERGVGTELAGAVRMNFDPAGLTCTLEVPLAGGGSTEHDQAE